MNSSQCLTLVLLSVFCMPARSQHPTPHACNHASPPPGHACQPSNLPTASLSAAASLTISATPLPSASRQATCASTTTPSTLPTASTTTPSTLATASTTSMPSATRQATASPSLSPSALPAVSSSSLPSKAPQSGDQLCPVPVARNATDVRIEADYCSGTCKTRPKISIHNIDGTDASLRLVYHPDCPHGSKFVVDVVDGTDNIIESLVFDDHRVQILDCDGLSLATIDTKPGFTFLADGGWEYHMILRPASGSGTLAWVFANVDSDNYFAFRDDHMIDVAVANNRVSSDSCVSSWHISFTDNPAIEQARDPRVMLAVTITKEFLQKRKHQTSDAASVNPIDMRVVLGAAAAITGASILGALL